VIAKKANLLGRCAVVGGLAVALVASACSSSGGKGTAGKSGANAPIVIGGAAATTGQVYNEPELQAGLEAAVSSINAAGGVNGHPLQLKFCDTQFNANKEISCARELVADKVAATFMPEFLADASGSAYKVLDQAKIPQIGTSGSLPSSLKDPYSYPTSSGLPGWFYGNMAALIAAGSRKFSVIDAAGQPSAQFASELEIQALKLAGITDVTHVTWDPTSDPTGDAAAAKAVSSGADGIGLAMATQLMPRIIKSVKQASYTGRMATVSSIFPQSLITQLGAAANGIYVVSQIGFLTDDKNPGVARYAADLKKYKPGSEPLDIGLYSWSAVQLFAAAAQSLATFTPSSIKQALDSLSSPVDIGSVAPWAVAGRTSPFPDYPRVVNPTVQIGVVENGAVVPDGKGFVNPIDLLTARPTG